MIKFSYKAITSDGQPRNGSIEAHAQPQAVRQLQQTGLVVLNICEAGEESGAGASPTLSLGGRISLRNLMEFTSETSSLLDAGVPLEQALKTQAELCPHERFKAVLTEIWQDVTGGAAFADALAKHRKVFEPFYVNMVRGG
ncbi:type II secretion system F family protein, partial [Verrucomicrobiota bacterium]